MTDYIMQMRPLFGEEEKRAICSYMDEDGFLTEYKHTEEFENKIAEFTGAKHCIVVNNGTVSLTLAAIALGITSGDDVIVPNYTMIATPNSIKILGANPIFVDVEPQTLILDINLVRKAITSNTKAIMLVSANGRAPSVDIDKFEALSEETGIPLIEDSAQSLGSYYPDGRHIGRAGCIGSLSFSAPKIISTGQGGALITDNTEIAKKLRKLKDFGRSSGGNDFHDMVGYNFKFTELQACIGLAQIQKLPDRLNRKKEIWKRYKNNLKGLKGINLFDHDLSLCTPWFIDSICENRDQLKKYLHECGIGSREMYPPINEQIAYSFPGDFPVSKKVGSSGLWLPSMIQLTDMQIDFICESIHKFFKAPKIDL